LFLPIDGLPAERGQILRLLLERKLHHHRLRRQRPANHPASAPEHLSAAPSDHHYPGQWKQRRLLLRHLGPVRWYWLERSQVLPVWHHLQVPKRLVRPLQHIPTINFAESTLGTLSASKQIQSRTAASTFQFAHTPSQPINILDICELCSRSIPTFLGHWPDNLCINLFAPKILIYCCDRLIPGV